MSTHYCSSHEDVLREKDCLDCSFSPKKRQEELERSTRQAFAREVVEWVAKSDLSDPDRSYVTWAVTSLANPQEFEDVPEPPCYHVNYVRCKRASCPVPPNPQ